MPSKSLAMSAVSERHGLAITCKRLGSYPRERPGEQHRSGQNRIQRTDVVSPLTRPIIAYQGFLSSMQVNPRGKDVASGLRDCGSVGQPVELLLV